MSLRVDPQLLGTKFYRMAIYFEGKLLGEYERSQAADIDRKTEEIQCALPKLLEISQTHGEFRVRWDGKRGVKSVRVSDIEVWQIPKDLLA
jgi:hypothetical protein